MMTTLLDSILAFPLFEDFNGLFNFLGETVSKPIGRHYQTIGKSGRPHVLSPLNKFFWCYVDCDYSYWNKTWHTGPMCHNQLYPRPSTCGLIFCKFKEVPLWLSREIVDNNMS